MTGPDAPAPILLHAHLFKNAGSTFDWSLARSFGDAFLDHRDDAAMRGQPAFLRAFIDAHPQLRALSSHWLPLPAADTERRRVACVAFLRDPLLRLQSVYEFERRQDLDHPGTRRAREGSLQEYVAWRLEATTGPVLRNYQTRMLSGVYPGDGNEAQYDRARAHLDALGFVGLVERYDESMVLLEARLGPIFPDLDLAYVAQNVSDPGRAAASFDARREAVKGRLGNLLEPVLAANARDRALYAQTAERFEAAWKSLPGRDEKLAEFRARCRTLAS